MAAGTTESTFFENEFGTVTDRRVIYYRAKGWFGGGSREDIPLQHVTSVRLETSRHWIAGIFLLFLGLGLMKGPSDSSVFGVIVLALAGLLLWGSPRVVVNTSGNDLRPSTGRPWQRKDATAFVEALRGKLFSDTRGPV